MVAVILKGFILGGAEDGVSVCIPKSQWLFRKEVVVVHDQKINIQVFPLPNLIFHSKSLRTFNTNIQINISSFDLVCCNKDFKLLPDPVQKKKFIDQVSVLPRRGLNVRHIGKYPKFLINQNIQNHSPPNVDGFYHLSNRND